MKGGKVTPVSDGPFLDPSKGKKASLTGELVDFHIHQIGTVKVPGGTAIWTQPPSNTDIRTATGTDYVFGMREGSIYIYLYK